MRRYEFYKIRGSTLAVTTCDCCREGRYQDAWISKGKTTGRSTGVSPAMLQYWTLITQKEAMKRAPDLLHKDEWVRE